MKSPGRFIHLTDITHYVEVNDVSEELYFLKRVWSSLFDELFILFHVKVDVLYLSCVLK